MKKRYFILSRTVEEPSLHGYQTIGCHVKDNKYIPISAVKPTRCTNVSHLFYFGMTFYMFRTVFPSIIRSSRLYIQQQAYVKQILLSACELASCQQTCMTYTIAVCTVLDFWRWTEELSETCRVLFQK